MSFYEPQGWQAPVRQASWEQPAPPSRSGASSTTLKDDPYAFATQFEEVDRAIDNLVKNGKLYTGSSRRDSVPQTFNSPGRNFDHGSRFHGGGGGGGGRHSVSENNPIRFSPAPNMQNFYASQRFQGRQPEVDTMMQAKRRMAAQRERELRNYHQEQQYNRSKGVLAEMASNKSDRSMSPSTISEEGRRELIARQHRALYGADAPGYPPQGAYADEPSGTNVPSSSGGVRGSSPRGLDPFGGSGQQLPGDNTMPGSAGTGDRKVASPTTQQGSGKVPTPPTGEEPSHSRQISKSTTAPLGGTMGPIGSRPSGPQAPGQSLNKRTTSPLPSSMGYGFGPNDSANERAASSNSNAANQKDASNSTSGVWGTSSGVWGPNKIGAPVWG